MGSSACQGRTFSGLLDGFFVFVFTTEVLVSGVDFTVFDVVLLVEIVVVVDLVILVTLVAVVLVNAFVDDLVEVEAVRAI